MPNMLAKFHALFKIIAFFLALFFLLVSFASDFPDANLPIPKWIPSSGPDFIVDSEALSKKGATASRPHHLTELKAARIEDASTNASPSLPFSSPVRDNNETMLKEVPAYIKAIMDPEDTVFPRLECPIPNHGRYHYLKADYEDMTSRPKYFFALDLHQRASLLPRLFGSIVESMRFLGPHNCALSVVEGRSDDGTFEILSSLRDELECMGARYYFSSSDIDPIAENRVQDGDRIRALATLRNQALQPLLDNFDKGNSTENTTIVFLNDVAICSEDILELIHQRRYQNADMVCGMDWTSTEYYPTFYDVWIARGMNGDTFFDIPPDGNWDLAWRIFWNNPTALEHRSTGKPFQGFSGWNGATAFTARPFLESQIRFRPASPHECPDGEPKTWCSDLWRLGYGRIAVVPIVNVEYSDEAASKIKDVKGYVSNWMGEGSGCDERVVWEPQAPKKVKCMPTYGNQTWVPWEERGGERGDGSSRGADLV